MSIYPVKVKRWFPPSDKSKDNKSRRSTIHSLLPYMECIVCKKKKLKMGSVWVYHALPWGYGCMDAWCSTWCYEKDI